MKIPRHSKFGSLEAKGNHLADVSAKNADLKGTDSSQNSAMVQRDISPNDNLEKLTREAQQLASEKKKTKIGNSTTFGLIQRKSSGLGQITIQSCWRL